MATGQFTRAGLNAAITLVDFGAGRQRRANRGPAFVSRIALRITGMLQGMPLFYNIRKG